MADISKITIESGTYDIKDGFLREKSIITFENVSSLKLNEKLQNGYYVRTLGYYNESDDGSAYYLIRTKTQNDVIDDMLILSLYDNNLVAELLILDDKLNIKQLGAHGDGSNDDSDYLIKGLSVVNKIIITSGNYYINKVVNLQNNTTLYGNNYRDCKLSFGLSGSLNFNGASINFGGPHKDFLTIENLNLSNFDTNSRNTPFLNLIACSYVKLINCWIYGAGKQILMWECFDSRIINCDFEWGGSNNSDVIGLELRSGNGGDSSLNIYDSTNNLYVYGCRFESHIGKCVATKGNGTNKIIFESCKFESFNCLQQNAIRFTQSNSIYFNDCVFAGDFSNTQNYLYIDQVNDFVITGYAEQANPNSLSYNNKRLIYCTGTGKRIIKLNLNNNNAYTIDNRTFGLDTWMDNSNDLFLNADIQVNDFSNKNTIITSKNNGVATLQSGSTSLDYNAPSDGWIYVTISGTWGQTTPQRISIKNTTSNYNLMLLTIADNYVSGFMPVAKGDNIICDGNTTDIAYITFYNSRSYNLQ